MTDTHTYPPLTLKEIALEVHDSGGAKHQATIWPAQLTEDSVTGTVEWDGEPPQFSLLTARGTWLTPWSQRLLLIYAATDETSMPEANFLSAGKWSAANLSLQHVYGEPGELVRVSLSGLHKLATLQVDAHPGLSSVLHIPPMLQTAPVGLAMVEMTSRLLFGNPWLAQ